MEPVEIDFIYGGNTQTEGKKIEQSMDNIAGNSKKAQDGIANMTRSLIQLGGIASIGMLGKQILEVTAKFEKFGIVLRNSLGDEKGNASLDMITKFAATTPFQLDEVTDSFIRMANQGFVPTSGQMTKLGDLASSTGKSFNQLSEAILDAQTGEFERLKEFGIKASANGDKVTFSFKEQKTTIDNTSSAIQGYILSLGELNGVQGANAKISASLTGELSNTKDKIESIYNEIGKSNSGAVYEGIGLFNKLLDNYQSIGSAVMGLVAVYGAYKASIIVLNAVSSLQAKIAYQQMLANIGNTGATIKLTTVQGIQAVVLSNLTRLQLALNKSILANPYVLAATAVAGLVVALSMYAKSAAEVRTQKELLSDVEIEAGRNTKSEISQLESLKKVLNDSAKSYGERRAALDKIREIVPDYHASLTSEGILINNNSAALENYVNKLVIAEKIKVAATKQAAAQEEFDNYKSENKGVLKNAVKKKYNGEELFAGESAAFNTWTRLSQEVSNFDNIINQLQTDLVSLDAAPKTESSIRNKNFWEKQKKSAEDALSLMTEADKKSGEWAKQVKLLNEADAKLKIWDFSKEKDKSKKSIYDAGKEINELIADVNSRRKQLELDNQKDSLQNRLLAIEFEKDEEIRKMEDKEASILAAYNKNHKDDKGFVAKTSLAQIDPALAKQLAAEKLKITSEYGKKEVTETETYQKEITDLVMGFADERTQIAYNYNKDIEKANEKGLTEFAARMEKEKQDRIDAVTIGLIEETDLYKTATDEKLQLSRETTELLIADLQKRIDAEIAAGKLSKAEGDKMLADLNKVQTEISDKKNQNNPFAQLGAAISGNTAAQKAFKNAPIGTSTEELAKLEDAANKSRTSMAAAAGESLQGVNAILGSVVGGLDQLGLLTDEQKKDADQVMGMVGGAANIAMGIATGNPIAIIQGAVDLLVNAIEFFDFKNKALEKSQKQHMKNVDDLELKYKKLQRAVETALGTDIYKAQRDEIENRKKQIQEYEAWLVLEQQKKKRKQDADKIAETQGLIDDLKQQNEDEVKALTEALAQTDVKSLATELSYALVTAFQNGENAAEAMGDVVNNVLRNAVVNALKLKILDKLLAPAIDQFAQDVEDNGGLDGEEGALFKKTVTQAGELYFKALNEANDALGGIFNGDGTNQTGIKGDVAKMTEETGSALVGQITAMRLNVVALLNNSKNSLDAVGKVLATLETIKDNTDRLNRIDETLYYIKQNGIKVQ